MVRRITLLAVVFALCLGALPGAVQAGGPKFTPGSARMGDPYRRGRTARAGPCPRRSVPAPVR